MGRSCFCFSVMLLAISGSAVHAETYSWTDEQGTVHFTEDRGAVPKQYHKKLRKLDEEPVTDGESSAAEPGAKGETMPRPAAPAARPGQHDYTSELFAGKTYGQWQKELADQEAAMQAIKERMAEIAPVLKNYDTSLDEQKRLWEEQKDLETRFRELKARYFQLVDEARKAGLRVDIQQ